MDKNVRMINDNVNKRVERMVRGIEEREARRDAEIAEIQKTLEQVMKSVAVRKERYRIQNSKTKSYIGYSEEGERIYY